MAMHPMAHRQSSLHLQLTKGTPGAGPRNAAYRETGVTAPAARTGLRPGVSAKENEFRALAENLPDAVVRYDLHLRCIYANPAAEACLDRTWATLIGKRNRALGLPRRLAKDLDDNLRLVTASGQARSIEFTLQTPWGDRQVEARIVPEPDDDGAVTGALVICRDVSERRHAEAALLRKTIELERINAELEEFAYVASHDLKGPLRNVHYLSTWLEEEIGEHLSEEGRERMILLRARLQRMDELINSTLEYARAGALIGPVEEVRVAELVDQVSVALPLPGAFTLSLSTRMPRLRTDGRLLYQVFSNLIGNAVIHHDRRDGHIWVTCRDRAERYEFSVVDDGPGIPAEYHQRIFHMFQRGPDKHPGSGGGTGLAVAKKIVERLGGEMEVESDVGLGTTFRFTWPKRLE